MNKIAIKKMIAEVVEATQGCKATELLFRMDDGLRKIFFNGDFDYPTLLQEMIAEGMLVEVAYTLPSMDYRCKSFLLPAGSKYGSDIQP